MTGTIKFSDSVFPYRLINIKGWGKNLMISTLDLQNQLITNHDCYCSEEARKVDEQVFFFVSENEINLPESGLSKIILESLS